MLSDVHGDHDQVDIRMRGKIGGIIERQPRPGGLGASAGGLHACGAYCPDLEIAGQGFQCWNMHRAGPSAVGACPYDPRANCARHLGGLKWSSQHGWRYPATGPAPVLRRGQGIRPDGISSCFFGGIFWFGRDHLSVPACSLLRPPSGAAVRDGRQAVGATWLGASRPLLDGREHGGGMVCAGIYGPLLGRRWREVAE